VQVATSIADTAAVCLFGVAIILWILMVSFVFVLAPIGASPSSGALSFYALPRARGSGAYDLHPRMVRQQLGFARSTAATDNATADRRAVIVPIS
jgi:hypothetical protein